jgi:hypothetical protein
MTPFEWMVYDSDMGRKGSLERKSLRSREEKREVILIV